MAAVLVMFHTVVDLEIHAFLLYLPKVRDFTRAFKRFRTRRRRQSLLDALEEEGILRQIPGEGEPWGILLVEDVETRRRCL
jgi:hypothetical protein